MCIEHAHFWFFSTPNVLHRWSALTHFFIRPSTNLESDSSHVHQQSLHWRTESGSIRPPPKSALTHCHPSASNIDRDAPQNAPRFQNGLVRFQWTPPSNINFTKFRSILLSVPTLFMSQWTLFAQFVHVCAAHRYPLLYKCTDEYLWVVPPLHLHLWSCHAVQTPVKPNILVPKHFVQYLVSSNLKPFHDLSTPRSMLSPCYEHTTLNWTSRQETNLYEEHVAILRIQKLRGVLPRDPLSTLLSLGRPGVYINNPPAGSRRGGDTSLCGGVPSVSLLGHILPLSACSPTSTGKALILFTVLSNISILLMPQYFS